MMATLRMFLGSSMRWSTARWGAQSSPTRGTCVGALLRAAALCWLALEPAAVAQQADWSGVEAPAESFSLQDDGTSLGGNPGGLAFASGLEADFLHNGFYVPAAACTLGSCLSETNGHTEALFLTAGIGPLSLGVGFDW